MRRRRLWMFAGALAAGLLVAGCTQPPDNEPPAPTETLPTIAEPERFGADRVLADIRHLAETIGPRHATSAEFAESADWVERRFADLGYSVTRQEVDTPAGNSWGVEVPAGTSVNIVADHPDAVPTEPHLVVGAHLDTVPAAPGAEDNASGVAVMLELARLAAETETPVRFVAFGAEEPRGQGDDLHHFGSQQYVADLDDDERSAVMAMVALDRVGVGGAPVPICSAPGGATDLRDELAAAADQAGVDHDLCDDNTTSDHWSFTKAGLPAARLGSLPFDGYHSPGDTVDVIDPGQLDRVGAIMSSWLIAAG